MMWINFIRNDDAYKVLLVTIQIDDALPVIYIPVQFSYLKETENFFLHSFSDFHQLIL